MKYLYNKSVEYGIISYNIYIYIYLFKNYHYFQLHACYDNSKDKYINHRIIQAFETANFIRITSTNSDLAVLAGDLNSDPNEIYYKLIKLSANMKDCYSSVIVHYNHNIFVLLLIISNIN